MAAIAEKVRELRREHALTQRDLAKKAGIAQTTVVDIERGVRTPHPSTLRKLASGLGVPPSALQDTPEAALGQAHALDRDPPPLVESLAVDPFLVLARDAVAAVATRNHAYAPRLRELGDLAATRLTKVLAPHGVALSGFLRAVADQIEAPVDVRPDEVLATGKMLLDAVRPRPRGEGQPDWRAPLEATCRGYAGLLVNDTPRRFQDAAGALGLEHMDLTLDLLGAPKPLPTTGDDPAGDGHVVVDAFVSMLSTFGFVNLPRGAVAPV